MDILLDTHVLIWSLFDDDKLPIYVKEIIENPNNDIFYSVASLWEIEIKHQKHPELMPYSMKQIFNVIIGGTDFDVVGITPEYLLSLGDVIKEDIHSDPFDHMLISTAKCMKAKLITHNKTIEKYHNVDALIV